MEYKGYTINIVHDDDPENPRNWDNFGKLALFHRRYDLPNDDNLTLQEVKEMLCNGGYIFVHVWGYDHGGLSIKAGDRTYPYNDTWDSGLLGFAYVSIEKVIKEFDKREEINKHRSITNTVKNLLIAEVETLNQYYMGDVWGYEILDSEGDYLDSCYGYYEDAESSGLLDNAKDYIDWYIADQEEKEHKLLSRVEMYVE